MKGINPMMKFEVKSFKLTAGDYINLPCKLPCSLYSVLLDNRLIDSPYYRENKDFSPVSEGRVELTAQVILNKAAASSRFLYLSVDGIYGEAEIFFNGKSRGMLRSGERKYTVDITDGAVEGENTVSFLFFAPPKQILEARLSGGEVSAIATVPFLKDMGILGSCEILATNDAVIDKVALTQHHGEGGVELKIKLSTLGDDEDIRAVATLVSSVGRMYFGSVINGRGSIRVPDPQLWWPNGLGEPYIYTLTVTLYKGEEAEDMRQIKLGLRDAQVSEAEGGIAIRINGREFLPFALT